MTTAEQLGISDERMMEIRDLVIDRMQTIKANHEDLDVATIVKRTADVPNDMEEAIMIGITIGESLAQVRLGPLGLLMSLMK